MKTLKFIIAAIFMLSALGCEDFLDINQDPNNPADVPEELALAPAISGGCYVFGGWWQILGGIWAQHWTQSTGASQYKDFEDYQVTPSTFDRQWAAIYAEALNDLEKIRNSSREAKNWNYYLISTSVQSWIFQMMTDCFDKIPFTQALQGDAGVIKPMYDDGSLVYDSLIARIDFALAQDFELSSNVEPQNDDLIFAGDMSAWVAFANTLKLKIYLRQVYARPSVSETGIQSMIDDGATFLTDMDAAMTQFTDEQDRRNPVYETGVDRLGGNISASGTCLYLLDDNSDSRLDAYFNTPQAGGVHFALAQGDYKATTPTNIQGLSTPALSYDDPVYLFSQAEVNFLLAEAAVRYPALGLDAKTYYDAGVTAAFAKHGLSAASYIASAGIYEFPASGTEEEKIEQIILQKWISMTNSQGVEAWLEYNRTHYPEFLVPSLNNVTGDRMPKRFLWSADERSQNAENVPALEPVYTKVWWDVKP